MIQSLMELSTAARDRDFKGVGKRTKYEYDDNRNRTVVRKGQATGGDESAQTVGADPYNVVQTIYDTRNLPFQTIRGGGSPQASTRHFDYDGNAELVQITEGDQITALQYDHFGRKQQVTDAMGNVTEYLYDLQNKKTTIRVVGQLNDVPGDTNNTLLAETIAYLDALGRMTRIDRKLFDPNTGQPIETDHDQDGYATTVVQFAGVSWVHKVWDDRQNLTTTTYDRANRVHEVIDAKGNKTTYNYTLNSRIGQITSFGVSDLGLDPLTLTTSFTYDLLDRLRTETDGLGHSDEYFYDARGNTALLIDKNGNQTLREYDRLSRLRTTTHKMTDTGVGGGVELPSVVTHQFWDESSRLAGQMDPNGNLTTYDYDALDRLTDVTYEDGSQSITEYDIHGNPEVFTDQNDTVVENDYDFLNRLTSRTVTAASGVAPSIMPETYAYDGLSRLIHAQDSDTAIVRSYDSLGSLLTEELTIVKPDATSLVAEVSSEYDGVGNRLTVDYPGGRHLVFTPDVLNRAQVITEGANQYRYDYLGPRVQRKQFANGFYSVRTFDSLGRPEGSKEYNNLGTQIDGVSYTWDDMSNKTGRHHYRSALTTTGTSEALTYDSLYRLKHHLQEWATGETTDRDFELDAAGNRNSVQDASADPELYYLLPGTPRFDFEVNQYTATPAATQEHDDNGNLKQRRPRHPHDFDLDSDVDQDDLTLVEQCFSGPNVPLNDENCAFADLNDDGMVDLGDVIVMQADLLAGATAGPPSTITYDYRNRMVEYADGATGQVHRYYYDALGRRVGKAVDVNGLNQVAYYLYDGEQIIEERDAAGVVKASYVNGRYVDEILSMTRTQTYYFHQDDQYNTLRATLNTTRGEWYEYGSFGEPTFLGNTQSRIPATLIGNNRLWNGREYDAETHLYYYRTRYLDPRAGRFTTRDTIGIWGDPMNLGDGYTYVGNNPWTYVDPYGLGMLASPRGGGMNRVFQEPTRAPYQYRRGEYLEEQLRLSDLERTRAEAHLRLLNFGADWSTSLTPFVNDGRDLVGAWRGYDEFSQEELTTVDRTLYGASVIIGSGAALKKAKDRGLKSACRLWEWLKRKLGKNRHFIDDMTPAEAKRYRDYWERAEGYPMQGAPYQMKTWHHPDGTIKTVQTYDEKGHFHRQYGVTERNHAPHQHNAKKRNTKNGNAPERDPVHRPIDE